MLNFHAYTIITLDRSSMNQSIKSCAKLQEPRLTLSSLQIFFHVFKDLVGGEEPERKLLAVGDRSFICELLDDP